LKVSGNFIWFSALPACSSVQLDQDLLLHVLHINGVSRCVFKSISSPPCAVTAGPLASSVTVSGPVAAVAPAPVVCGGTGAGYRLRRLDPMQGSIHQQKTLVDIYYCGVLVQLAGQYTQGTVNTRTMQKQITQRSMNMKEYTRI
jgi:hypothetical protein